MQNITTNSNADNATVLELAGLSFSYYHNIDLPKKSNQLFKSPLQRPLTKVAKSPTTLIAKPILQSSKGAKKVYAHKVINNVSFSLAPGETAVIGGPSGCGKSTLLRLIAGFETPQEGCIYLNGTLHSTPAHCVSPELRKIGFVFQDHALFPQMTVEKNIRFGIAHLSIDEQEERIIDILHKIKLSRFANRYPDELSIGQIQRVALARALVTEPSLLMLDEPFSSIDKDTSLHLIEELQSIKNTSTAILLITHEAIEAMYLADTIMLINDGVIVQKGSPHDLYHKPKTHDIAAYFDEVNYLPVQQSVCGQLCSPCGFIDQALIENYSRFRDTKFFHLCVRPHMIQIRTNTKARYQQENWVVIKKYFMGNHYKIILESMHPLFQGMRITVVQELHTRWPQEKEIIQVVLTAKSLWALEIVENH